MSVAHEKITAKIIEQLEDGVVPWQQCWDSAPLRFPLRHNGENYRGINVLMLWCEALSKGYASPYWMTYKQALELGGQVRGM
jgi:antirestriction protein ArdC